MKIILILLSVTAMLFLSHLAFADGDVKKGKALFSDPKLSGSSFGVSCNMCHPNGKGLEKSVASRKKEYGNSSSEQKGLEEKINTCILMANKGQPLDLKSQEMKDLIAYIESLNTKTKKNSPKAD
jgi:cytochrome c